MTEGEVCMFDETTMRCQRAAMSGNWRLFKKILEEDTKCLVEPFDLFGNTAIHVATRSNNPRLLRELLEALPEKDRWQALRKGNCVNNTLLHEIIFCTTVEMASVVFKFEKEVPEEHKGLPLLELTNNSGETPLFRAAKLGKLKMLKFMAQHAQADIRTLFVRFDKYSILHASILGQFFDVAIWLLNTDEKLAQHKDMNGMTCLQLLSNMPLVFRSQAPSMGTMKNLIYYCTSLSQYFFLLPEEGYEIDEDDGDEDGSVDFRQRSDLESGQQDKAKLPSSEFNGIGHIWQRKKQHKLAEHLAGLLVQRDFSWQISFHENFQPLIVMPVLSSKSDRIKHIHHMKEMHKTNSEIFHSKSYRPITTATSIPHSKNYTPLLMAAGSGIVEIVEKIIERYPEAICHVSQDEHNVLHMAVKHRQLKIFNMLKKHSAFKSLVSRITAEGRTLFHQISRMEFYVEQHLPGVAFQLQDELRWYERVRKIVPPHYLMHCDKDGLTAEDVLEMEHRKMHKEAKGWIKETAQSCSTVSVLVATVVFAAAYTIPGGTNQNNGTPVFLGSRVFLFFTVTDVVALVSSLVSVVMFLSILTSPFELWDFRRSLPGKLSLGFAFLFFSLVCTMLTFSATVLLTIRFENHRKWASILFCSAVFFPVAIFWRMQFPLYKMIQRFLKRLFKTLKQAIPTTFINYSTKRTHRINYHIHYH
ncbi:Ankyrin repeat-containing protein ITN1, partial [Mucuna pruriens]